jgi:hypothetical protein
MGSINITRVGTGEANVKGRLSYTATFTFPDSKAEGSRDPRYAVLYIQEQDGRPVDAISPLSSVAGASGSATFSSDDVSIGRFRNCLNCEWVSGQYQIVIRYVSPINGLQTTYIAESGTVSVSGPLSCPDCDGDADAPDGDAGGDGGDDDTGDAGDFGPNTPGDPLPPWPPRASAPCLPPPYTPPPVPVSTPCKDEPAGSGPSGFGI